MELGIEIKVTSKYPEDYWTSEYEKTGLPKAPAIMVCGSVVDVGGDIEEDKLLLELKKRIA